MDSTGKEREAVQLMAEAEKRVKGSHSFLRGLFGGCKKGGAGAPEERGPVCVCLQGGSWVLCHPPSLGEGLP
uniref:Uncharacterized protein n=1 Tax=Otus sunia TaxID=257818 RepID=A0A8C8ADJ3_9STRI